MSMQCSTLRPDLATWGPSASAESWRLSLLLLGASLLAEGPIASARSGPWEVQAGFLP